MLKQIKIQQFLIYQTKGQYPWLVHIKFLVKTLRNQTQHYTERVIHHELMLFILLMQIDSSIWAK